MIWLLLLAGVFAVPGSKPFRLRRSKYSGSSSKLSLQTVRGCGDGTPQASSIIIPKEQLISTVMCCGSQHIVQMAEQAPT